MWTRQHKQRNTGRFIVPAISVLFLSYFGFHAYNGEYGIYSKYQLEARRAELAVWGPDFFRAQPQRNEPFRCMAAMH